MTPIKHKKKYLREPSLENLEHIYWNIYLEHWITKRIKKIGWSWRFQYTILSWRKSESWSLLIDFLSFRKNTYFSMRIKKPITNKWGKRWICSIVAYSNVEKRQWSIWIISGNCWMNTIPSLQWIIFENLIFLVMLWAITNGQNNGYAKVN